jgi:osmotically-inducible protein OsmY
MVAKMQRAISPRDLSEIVLDQIHQNPEIRDAEISATSDQGIVMLTGSVKSDRERIAVESAVRKVPGVRALASDLAVKPVPDRGSADIARDIVKQLSSHMFLAGEHIQATVRDGLVTLEGDVHQELQRMLAEAEVKRVRGICGLSNKLQIKPQAPERKEVETTLQERAGPLNDQPWVEIGEAEAG